MCVCVCVCVCIYIYIYIYELAYRHYFDIDSRFYLRKCVILPCSISRHLMPFLNRPTVTLSSAVFPSTNVRNENKHIFIKILLCIYHVHIMIPCHEKGRDREV